MVQQPVIVSTWMRPEPWNTPESHTLYAITFTGSWVTKVFLVENVVRDASHAPQSLIACELLADGTLGEDVILSYSGLMLRRIDPPQEA